MFSFTVGPDDDPFVAATLPPGDNAWSATSQDNVPYNNVTPRVQSGTDASTATSGQCAANSVPKSTRSPGSAPDTAGVLALFTVRDAGGRWAKEVAFPIKYGILLTNGGGFTVYHEEHPNDKHWTILFPPFSIIKRVRPCMRCLVTHGLDFKRHCDDGFPCQGCLLNGQRCIPVQVQLPTTEYIDGNELIEKCVDEVQVHQNSPEYTALQRRIQERMAALGPAYNTPASAARKRTYSDSDECSPTVCTGYQVADVDDKQTGYQLEDVFGPDPSDAARTTTPDRGRSRTASRTIPPHREDARMPSAVLRHTQPPTTTPRTRAQRRMMDAMQNVSLSSPVTMTVPIHHRTASAKNTGTGYAAQSAISGHKRTRASTLSATLNEPWADGNLVRWRVGSTGAMASLGGAPLGRSARARRTPSTPASGSRSRSATGIGSPGKRQYNIGASNPPADVDLGGLELTGAEIATFLINVINRPECALRLIDNGWSAKSLTDYHNWTRGLLHEPSEGADRTSFVKIIQRVMRERTGQPGWTQRVHVCNPTPELGTAGWATTASAPTYSLRLMGQTVGNWPPEAHSLNLTRAVRFAVENPAVPEDELRFPTHVRAICAGLPGGFRVADRAENVDQMILRDFREFRDGR